MSTQMRAAWRVTRDGWRFCQITSTEFVLGARPGTGNYASQRSTMVGGTTYPAGSYLVWAPGAPYSQGVLAAEYLPWLRVHGGEHEA